MKLDEIADRLAEHLKRWERDPEINAPSPDRGNSRPYFGAWALRNGRYVSVTYVSYQLTTHLTKAEAQAYLDWIEAGNVGTHHTMKRTVQP